MAQVINRVHEALNRWKTMEENNASLFSSEIMSSSGFVKLRLSKIDELIAGISFNALPEEKDSLKLLAIERKLLVEKAYPRKKKWSRLFYFITQPVRAWISRRLAQREHTRQLEQIRISMQQAGFAEHTNTVLARIKQGEQNFSLSATLLPSPYEQVQFQLQFSHTLKGYSFEDYAAIYRSELLPASPRSHRFSPDVPVNRAANLIAGRAILEPYFENGFEKERWMGLHSSRDSGGKLVTKYLPIDLLDLRKECEALPFWKQMNKMEQFRVLDDLKNGDRQGIEMESQGKVFQVYIETSVDQNIIRVTDKKGKVMEIKKMWPGEKKALSRPKVRLKGKIVPTQESSRTVKEEAKSTGMKPDPVNLQKKGRAKIHVRM